MRTATKYLLILFVFALVLGSVYWLVTREVAGTVLLLSFSLMPLIIASYAIRHGALRATAPEDDPVATPAQSAGEDLGEFPGATAWPILLVIGVITTGASLIYGLILLVAGLALMTWAILGLMHESRN